MPTISTPRPPSLEERQRIVAALNDVAPSTTPEEARNLIRLVDSAYIAVWDKYAAESPPEFQGKVLSVIWPFDPGTYEVFVEVNGRLRPQTQDPALAARPASQQPPTGTLHFDRN